MQKVIAQFKGSRRTTGTHAKQARIEFLGELANDATFASGVPTLQADDGCDVRRFRSILQFAETLLQLRHCFLIGRLGKTLLEIDFFEQFPRPLNNEQCTKDRRAIQCYQPASTGAANVESAFEAPFTR